MTSNEPANTVQGGLSDAEKRANVLRLAFGGDQERFDEFCRMIREEIPEGTGVVAAHRPPISRHAFLEIIPATTNWRVFGVHLSAVHAAWTERRRMFELRALLRAVGAHQKEPHILIGDFNTVAPGDIFDVSRLPRRLRALVWLSGGHIRWRTIATVLAAGYVDSFRQLHPEDVGYTLPTPDPHVRLDYAFVPGAFVRHVRSCEIVKTPDGRAHPIIFRCCSKSRNHRSRSDRSWNTAHLEPQVCTSLPSEWGRGTPSTSQVQKRTNGSA